MEENTEWDKTSKSKKHRMEKTPNGKNPEWYKTSNGTKRQMGENVEKKTSSMDTDMDRDTWMLTRADHVAPPTMADKRFPYVPVHVCVHGHGHVIKSYKKCIFSSFLHIHHSYRNTFHSSLYTSQNAVTK
jgi:hypothetical protein